MDALTNLGQFFSSSAGTGIGKIAELGATGAGAVGNILNNRQRSQELNYVKQAQNAASNPTELANEVTAATQPLNRNLVESVGNQVSGTLAEQGLSQAPGIQATALSQALAPFEQQNQNTALQLVMQKLGLPAQYASVLLSGLPPNTNLAPLIALLSGAGKGGVDINSILKLIQQNNPQAANQPTTPATPDWIANLPGITPPSAPNSNSWLPAGFPTDMSGLSLADLPPIQPPAPSFGG